MLILLTVVSGVAALTGLNRVANCVRSLSVDALDGVSTSSKLEAALLEMRDILRHIGSSDASQMAAIETNIGRLKQEIQASLVSVEGKVANDRE